MATPVKTPHTGKGVIKVEISVDFATKQINVIPYRFEVSKQAGDQVQWTCTQKHEHHGGGCFWAHFDKGSTFDRNEFRKHLELSGPPSKNAVVNKEYKYTRRRCKALATLRTLPTDSLMPRINRAWTASPDTGARR